MNWNMTYQDDVPKGLDNSVVVYYQFFVPTVLSQMNWKLPYQDNVPKVLDNSVVVLLPIFRTYGTFPNELKHDLPRWRP